MLPGAACEGHCPFPSDPFEKTSLSAPPKEDTQGAHAVEADLDTDHKAVCAGGALFHPLLPHWWE